MSSLSRLIFKKKYDKKLYKAANSGNIEAIKALYADGARLEWLDKNGRTPLALVCSKRKPRLDVIKTLIQLGADVNAYCKGHGGCGVHFWTPLHDVASRAFNENEELAKLLLDENEELAKLLLSNGADALMKDCNGKTPLDVARAKLNGRVVRAIEGCIRLFSGWMREFYQDDISNRLDTRDVWVVVLPCSSSTPSKPSKLELAIYSATLVGETLMPDGLSFPIQAGAKPREIFALWEAKLKKSNINHDDAAVVISCNSKESKIKLGPAKVGDKQQLQWFSNACKGSVQEMQRANPVQPQVPAVAGIGSSTTEKSELAMAISAFLPSAMEDMLSYRGTQTQLVSGAQASTSSTSSLENTNHKGSATLDVPASYEGTGNKSKVHYFAPSDNLAQHMDTESDVPAVFYKTFESPSLISAPSAPPIPDAIRDDGLIHYPSIDYYSQYFESSSTIAAEIKKEAGTTSCAICWDAPLEGACLPCGHMAGCMSCLNDIKARNMGCPVCRANVDQVTRIYISSSTEKKE